MADHHLHVSLEIFHAVEPAEDDEHDEPDDEGSDAGAKLVVDVEQLHAARLADHRQAQQEEEEDDAGPEGDLVGGDFNFRWTQVLIINKIN